MRTIVKVWLAGAALAAGVAWAQAPAPPAELVACEPGMEAPCVVLATEPADIVGVWKQYLGNPAFAESGGVAFIRYAPDGAYYLADSVENAAGPFAQFPRGHVTFADGVATIFVDNPPATMPQCATGAYQIRVIRAFDRPVALHYAPVADECMPRQNDLRTPLIWVAD